MSEDGKLIPPDRSDKVRSFLDTLARTPPSSLQPRRTVRIIFALDATASREATWQEAQLQQSAMFDEASALGGLMLQLCYYRGLNDFVASPWLSDAPSIKRLMNRVDCLGGLTQIGRVLEHALREARQQRIQAVVFIGDCVEEPPDQLSQLAGQLGVLNVPLFLFQEGYDNVAELTFRQLAKLSQGAYCRFDAGSARQLRELLGAVAAYATGGLAALEQLGRHRGGLALQLCHQIKPEP